jgi:hypothetical protein
VCARTQGAPRARRRHAVDSDLGHLDACQKLVADVAAKASGRPNNGTLLEQRVHTHEGKRDFLKSLAR